MTDSELAWRNSYDVAQLIKNRQVSPVEVMESVLGQLEKVEPKINAFVTVTAEAALAEAHKAEHIMATTSDPSQLGALFGVPISIKDLVDTAGVRTTYGTREYADHVPSKDAPNASRLRSAGAILFGKTTTPEFGMLGTTESPLTGITNNPWNTAYIAGGSSGGAAASVAAGVGGLAWGSDGGGSIRVPASACGVVGLKASAGRIPGPVLWDSASVEGPITRSVIDAALLLQVTAGPSLADPLSLPADGTDYIGAVLRPAPLTGLKIAYAPKPAGGLVASEVLATMDTVVSMLESQGAIVEVIDLPLPDPVSFFLSFYGPSFTGALSAMGLTFDHPAILDLISRAPGAEAYLEAATVTRGEIWTTYARVFANHDFILTPTMPVVPFLHPGSAGGNTHVDGIPVAVPAIDFHRFTESPSHAGLPAISVPVGFSSEGLPIGAQIIGGRFDDVGILSLAANLEQLMPWGSRRPSLA